MPLVKLSSKNQIVIPSSVREQLGLHAGDELEVSVVDGKAIIDKAVKSYASQLLEQPAHIFSGYADELRQERDQWEP